MATVHFIGRQPNATGNLIYHVNINGTEYYYNWNTDELTNATTNVTIYRRDLPGDVLCAFHQAWDPDAYASAMETTPLNEYGFPNVMEDPSSPFYYPTKPEGEPVEVLCGSHRSRHRRGVRSPH